MEKALIGTLEARIADLEEILDSLPFKIGKWDTTTKDLIYSNQSFKANPFEYTSEQFVIADESIHLSAKARQSSIQSVIDVSSLGLSVVKTEDLKRLKQQIKFSSQRDDIISMTNSVGSYGISIDMDHLTFVNRYCTKWFKELRNQDLFPGLKVDAFMFPAVKEFIRSNLERIKRNETVQYENVYPTLDRLGRGKGLHVRGYFCPHADDDGKVTEFSHIYRDISTELENEEERISLIAREKMAQNSSKMKTEFLVQMSHELRTPLTGMLGLVSHLFSEVSLTEEQKKIAEECESCGQLLLTIINDVLDLNKIDAGKLEIECAPFDLQDLVEHNAKLVLQNLRKAKIPMVITISPSVFGKYKGDSIRITQILINLIANAIKFSNNSAVALTVEESTYVMKEDQKNIKALVFTIADNGIGISNEAKSKIFNAFSQADSSTTRKYGGTGLGLVICEKLVNLMGGVIGFTSEQGKPTIFWFMLPLQVEELAPEDLPLNPVIVDCQNELIKMVLVNYFGPIEGKEGPLILITDSLDSSKSKEASKIVHLKQITSNSSNSNDSMTSKVVNASVPYIAHTLITEKTIKKTNTQLFAKPEKHSNFVNAKVLIVDDNPINIKVLKLFLQKKGIECETACSGVEAVELFIKSKNEKKGYGIIFMDCLMPVMDGYEASMKIREIEAQEGNKNKRQVIVAITANMLKEDELHCLEVGMDVYLTKPFQMDKVLEICRRFLPNQ